MKRRPEIFPGAASFFRFLLPFFVARFDQIQNIHKLQNISGDVKPNWLYVAVVSALIFGVMAQSRKSIFWLYAQIKR